MTQTNAVAPTEAKAIRPIDGFRHQMDKMVGDLKAALPAQIPVERFVRTTLTAVALSPDLLDADRASLLASTMKAAQDGLLCDGREAALVIFNSKLKDKETGREQWIKKVQYMPMVSGLLKKMRNTGQVASITASVVRHKDEFDYVKGDEEKIIHRPFLDGPGGDVTFAYAIAKLDNGEVIREVMSRADIEKIRNVSRAKDSGPWKDWFDEMARKSVLRRIAKYLPSSQELDQVLRSDDETYDLQHREDMPRPPTKTDAIKERLRAREETDQDLAPTAIDQQVDAALPEPLRDIQPEHVQNG